ncbi:hypothetical protein PGB90_000233 [Kerria lacca]
MTGLLKFGIKGSILGGTIYYSKQIGVWDDSSRTFTLTQEIMAYVSPYLKPVISNVQKELPVQVTNLPTSDDICRTSVLYWNKGVISSVAFVRNVPNLVNSYINRSVTYIVNEIRKEKRILTENENS